MKIKAFAIHSKGSKPEAFFYERNVGGNELLVRITHCSVAKGDVQIMHDDWGDTKFPVVAGHEIIGIVEQAGDYVTDLKPGDRVGIGYQLEACFECEYCLQGNEQFCPKQKVIGVDLYGGLAEHIVVDSRFAFGIPASLDAATAAPLMSSGLTVYSAIIRGLLPQNANTAVLGIGGLGQLALQFLHKMGHHVSAFSHSPKKRGLIEQLGAQYIDASEAGNDIQYQKKFDFFISTLNVDFDLNSYLRMLKPQGKFCLVSQPPNKVAINIGLLYDYAQRSIYGNYTGSRGDMIDMLAFAAKHHIESSVETIPFSKMNEAIDKVATGNSLIRIVLQNDSKFQ